MRIILSAMYFCIIALPVMAGNILSGVQDVRLLHGWRMDNGKHMAAIEIVLDQGWKTYWRAPGPLGIPPRFVWNGSKNLESAQAIWPTPTVFRETYGQSIGYEDFLVLPIELTPTSSGPITVKLRMDFGVCKDICIPARATLAATLSPTEVKSKSSIAFALRALAKNAAKSNLKIACEFSPHKDGLTVKAKVSGQSLPSTAILVFEHSSQRLWFDRTKIEQKAYKVEATTVLNLPSDAAQVVQRSDIRVTLLGGARAIDFSGCPEGY